MYCTICEINWARLWSQEDDFSKESYEFCPHCGSDHHLVTKKKGPEFSKCPFSGDIRNVKTGELRIIIGKKVVQTGIQRRKVYTETLEELHIRQDEAQGQWMAEYNDLISSGMNAEEAARIAKREVVERKWKWNDEF